MTDCPCTFDATWCSIVNQFRGPAPGHLGQRDLPPREPAFPGPRDFADGVGDGAPERERRIVAQNAAGELESAAPAKGAGGSSPPLVADLSSNTESLKSTSLGAGGAAGEETAADPKLTEINQAIDDIRQSGDDRKLLAVVKVRVVDQAEGMMLVQNVFAEHNVVADDSESSLEKSENGSAAKRSIAKSTARRDSTFNGKEALYVVAKPE